MDILAHRGKWEKEEDKNSLESLLLALNLNFGIETDIRDFDGKLVISHDVPNKDSMPLNVLFQEYKVIQKEKGFANPIALNVKSDGIHEELKKLLIDYEINNYFVFDMSIPDSLNYINYGLNIFLRESEYEKILIDQSSFEGIWLDQFKETWFDKQILIEKIKSGKKVCIVSSELHARDHKYCWEVIASTLKELSNTEKRNIMICTDFPSEFKEYFDE